MLEDQFMLPTRLHKIMDCSARGLFSLVDPRALIEVTETELEIGFRKLKEALDDKGVGYKFFIFEIEPSSQDDDEKDAEELKVQMAEEARFAIPLMREEFI